MTDFPGCDHQAGFCVWTPLREIVGHESCDQFMFMGRAGVIYLYKHKDTRRYLNIDVDGRFWRYTAGGYEPVEKLKAFAGVFPGTR